MRRASKTTIGVLAYVAVAIPTFGYAAQQNYLAETEEEAICKAETPEKFCMENSSLSAIPGFTAAVLWPLYWSWEIAAITKAVQS